MRLLISLLLFCSTIYGQNDSTSTSFLNNRGFTLGIRPILTMPAKFKHFGEPLLKSRPLISGEIYFGYRYALNNGFYLLGNLGVGYMPVNVHYKFRNPDGNNVPQDVYPELDGKFSEYIFFPFWYGKFQISVERQIIFKHREKFYIGGGIQLFAFFVNGYGLGYQHSYSLDDSGMSGDITVFNTELTDTAYSTLKIAAMVELGYIVPLKNGNEIHIGLVYNYSPFKRASGFYQFLNLGVKSQGELYYNFNYLAIDLSFNFASRKRVKSTS